MCADVSLLSPLNSTSQHYRSYYVGGSIYLSPNVFSGQSSNEKEKGKGKGTGGRAGQQHFLPLGLDVGFFFSFFSSFSFPFYEFVCVGDLIRFKITK